MTLPSPVEIQPGDLSADGGHHQLERLEGMRVRVASNGVFYGVVAGSRRPFREPGIDVRQSLPAGAPCCVPRFDGNPERLRVDSDGQPGAPAINVPAGTVLRNVVGVLDYGFQSYTILPDPSTPPSVTAP